MRDLAADGAAFLVYPDSRHTPNWEEPEKFARDLNGIFAEGL